MSAVRQVFKVVVEHKPGRTFPWAASVTAPDGKQQHNIFQFRWTANRWVKRRIKRWPESSVTRYEVER